MAGIGTAEPRTLLEHLIREQDRTYQEVVDEFERIARDLGERGVSISVRHLRRLARAERTGGTGATPVIRRVLTAQFNYPAKELLEPFAQGEAVGLVSVGPALPTVDTQKEALVAAAKRAKEFWSVERTAMHNEMMEQVSADVSELASAYMRQPLSEILGSLLETQEDVFSRLEKRQKPDHARQLHVLSTVLGGMLANASHDLADPGTALSQARMAFMSAEQANDNGLRAWIRGMQSLITFRAGQPLKAIEYAQQGALFAEGTGSTLAVWLPASEARAWGKLGNASKAREAIERAERAWDQVRPNDLDEFGGICSTNRSEQLYYAADALTSLPAETNTARTAERYCIQAVEAYQDSSSPDWDFGCQACSQADLAIARLWRGEREGAAEALAPVLELPVGQRVNGVIQSVQRVHSLAADIPDIREQIETFTRTPLRALP